MLKTEKLPVIFLVCAGRAGGGLLHSLLDSHKQVITIPMELKFYEMWNRLRCDEIKSYEKMVDIWTTKTKINRLKTGIHYGLEENINNYTNCDYEKFTSVFSSSLKHIEMNSRNIFFALHHAYALSINQDISKVKQIIEFCANPSYIDKALIDFPKARFIQVMRDYRGNYLSWKQYFLNTNKSLFAVHGLKCNSLINDIHNNLAQGTKITEDYEKIVGLSNWLVVRHDELHLDLKNTMLSIAKWIGIENNQSLLKTTLGGKIWNGNSAFGKPITGPDKEVLYRWKKKLNSYEIAILDYHFENTMNRFGYKLTIQKTDKNNFKKFLYCLIPVRDEFNVSINKTAPVNKYLSILWSLSPIIVYCARFFYSINILLIGLINYPINKTKLFMLISKNEL